MDLTKEAIYAISDLTLKGAELVEKAVGGKQLIFSGGKIVSEDQPAVPNTLAFASLDALVAYIRGGYEAFARGNKPFVNVVSPTRVEFRGEADALYGVRPMIAVAEPMIPKLQLSTFCNLEEFIIMLSSGFVSSTELEEIIRCCAGIKVQDGQDYDDDGISQTVTVKSGIQMVKRMALPNPAQLAPFRTFTEITQPASSFLLRLSPAAKDTAPKIGLFEADGGAWRIQAMKFIKDYLDAALSGECEVLA